MHEIALLRFAWCSSALAPAGQFYTKNSLSRKYSPVAPQLSTAIRFRLFTRILKQRLCRAAKVIPDHPNARLSHGLDVRAGINLHLHRYSEDQASNH
ncbi:MAG: hypothetical protein RIR59_755 [Pseudomonadota bacterium]